MLREIQNEGDSAVEQFALEFDQQSPRIINLQPFEDYAIEAKNWPKQFE